MAPVERAIASGSAVPASIASAIRFGAPFQTRSRTGERSSGLTSIDSTSTPLKASASATRSTLVERGKRTSSSIGEA